MGCADTLTTTMTVMLTSVPEGVVRSMRVELTYDRTDPWAVGINFQIGRTEHSDWVLSRDLLSEGIFTAVGEGDVKIQPSGESRDTTRIELAPPGKRAVAEVVTSELQSFLNRTYDVVPLGQENDNLDLDVALWELLISMNG